MPIGLRRASLLATASFVLTFGVAVGPEGRAFAQQKKSPKATEQKKDDNEDKLDTEKKDEPPATEPKAEEPPPAKELDTSVEQPKAIYVAGDVAFTRSDLGGIVDNTGFDRTVANGLMYGLSTGLRLKGLRLGGRWRVQDTTEFALWSFGVEAGYGLSLRPVTPILSVHLAYVFDQSIERGLLKNSLPDGTILPPKIDVEGLLLGGELTASYWVTQFLRLGVFIGVDFMFLGRGRATPPRTIFGPPGGLANNPLYSEGGSAIGLNLNAGLRGAFDIGFK